jgi:hypothetical protein
MLLFSPNLSEEVKTNLKNQYEIRPYRTTQRFRKTVKQFLAACMERANRELYN